MRFLSPFTFTFALQKTKRLMNLMTFFLIASYDKLDPINQKLPFSHSVRNCHLIHILMKDSLFTISSCNDFPPEIISILAYCFSVTNKRRICPFGGIFRYNMAACFTAASRFAKILQYTENCIIIYPF